ncbi:MAG: AraC family transcriptional regulator [Chitinophagaceae bacterium]|nr:MAG: AraC family transcriptional regulator [Chitinophagaceae bacterium]
MEPRIVHLTQKILVGKHLLMSIADNKTGQLWQSFMPVRNTISHKTGTDLFSLQLYPPDYFLAFNPHTPFTKWAAAEVTEAGNIPVGMEVLLVEGGLYAVFPHTGMGTEIFSYIFSEWLPRSGYTLANRPHFELLGEKYKQGCDDSEEEIWIPVEPKP